MPGHFFAFRPNWTGAGNRSRLMDPLPILGVSDVPSMPPLQYCDGPWESPRRLRLLTYNVQAGIDTQRYRHYVTHGWKHVLPYPRRLRNIVRIGELVRDYDVVGLQEVDAGSLRSGHVNLTEYLAHLGEFPYWYDRTNRRLGRIARVGIGLLSRPYPAHISEHRLPGAGRGALWIRYGEGTEALVLVVAHLALGRRTRRRQLVYLARLLRPLRHVLLMGDMNCPPESRELRWFCEVTGLRVSDAGRGTWPSWRPVRQIDHILVSPTLAVDKVEVLDWRLSDHLLVAMELRLPPSLAICPPRPVALSQAG